MTGVCRLRSGENFITDGKEFIFNSFIYFKPVKRFENIGRCENLGSLTRPCAREFLQ